MADSAQGGGVDLFDWLRAELEADEGAALGAGYQATIRRVRGAQGDFVVKSPHRGRWLGRVARASMAREHAVYEHLAAVPGVARSFGLLDGEHLVLEHVEGPSLKEYEGELADRESFFDALLETILAMHAAGVAHGDLKRKYNVLVGPGERPYVIDFGIACIRRPRGGVIHGWWFRSFRQMDLNAYVKLRYGRRPADIAQRDRALYRPLWIERFARWVRIPWQKITLRRPRQRWRRRRERR